MSQKVNFEYLLVHGDTLLQAIQNHVYGKIAATWTRDNPDYPVIYPSAMILAMVRGLHLAWSEGELTGEQVARRLADLIHRDWGKLARSEITGEKHTKDPLGGQRGFRPFGIHPDERN